jgi:hypothetical protein
VPQALAQRDLRRQPLERAAGGGAADGHRLSGNRPARAGGEQQHRRDGESHPAGERLRVGGAQGEGGADHGLGQPVGALGGGAGEGRLGRRG